MKPVRGVLSIMLRLSETETYIELSQLWLVDGKKPENRIIIFCTWGISADYCIKRLVQR